MIKYKLAFRRNNPAYAHLEKQWFNKKGINLNILLERADLVDSQNINKENYLILRIGLILKNQADFKLYSYNREDDNGKRNTTGDSIILASSLSEGIGYANNGKTILLNPYLPLMNKLSVYAGAFQVSPFLFACSWRKMIDVDGKERNYFFMLYECNCILPEKIPQKDVVINKGDNFSDTLNGSPLDLEELRELIPVNNSLDRLAVELYSQKNLITEASVDDPQAVDADKYPLFAMRYFFNIQGFKRYIDTDMSGEDMNIIGLLSESFKFCELGQFRPAILLAWNALILKISIIPGVVSKQSDYKTIECAIENKLLSSEYKDIINVIRKKRNLCAHETDVTFTKEEAEYYIKNIVEIIKKI